MREAGWGAPMDAYANVTDPAKVTDFLCFATALKERCPPRQKSRVERLKAKVEFIFTRVTVDY